MLINLIGNALKFTPKNGSVVLRLDLESIVKDTVTLQFSVIDSGVGIPQEKQDYIFDAFTQADSSTTRKFGGTGLGLSISSRLVEMMGGEISLSSEPEIGTVFFFTAKFKTVSKKRAL